MVYNTQNYWVLGLSPLSSILETRKHNISETGSVSVLRWGGKTPTQLGPLERVNLLSRAMCHPCPCTTMLHGSGSVLETSHSGPPPALTFPPRPQTCTTCLFIIFYTLSFIFLLDHSHVDTAEPTRSSTSVYGTLTERWCGKHKIGAKPFQANNNLSASVYISVTTRKHNGSVYVTTRLQCHGFYRLAQNKRVFYYLAL
jgi:hypothetical protein